MEQPFNRGDLVICNLDYLTVKAGEKVRVIKCEPGDCQTGWLVTATTDIRGPMPKRPTISVEKVDSSWFVRVKKRAPAPAGER